MQVREVARQVGMATSAIRFYEEAGLLPEPERTASRYREYDQSVIDRLAFIRAGQGVGLTLNELREVLTIRDRGEPPCRHVNDLIDTHMREVDQRIRNLQRLRRISPLWLRRLPSSIRPTARRRACAGSSTAETEER